MNTNFVNNNTVINAEWLNPVDRAVFDAIGDGSVAPTDHATVKINLSLDQVNNTTDLDKPISTATQTALDLKQELLPTQVGNNGKYLQTNGTNTIWSTVDALPVQTGNSGKFLTTNGINPSWVRSTGATGAGTDQAFVENDTLITGDYTIGQGGLTDCTISIATPCNITVANDWVADQMVWLTTTGALPTGLDTNVAYYVLAAGLTTSNVRLSLTAGGAAINTTGTQSGVHKIAKCKNASIAGQFGTASGVTVTIPPGCTLVNT